MAHPFKRILIAGYTTKTANYVSALSHMNMIPITAFSEPLSNEDTSFALHTIVNEFYKYDGLLLPGGGDIDPIFFNEVNQGSKNIDSALDVIQFELLDLFVKANKPVLGICKGLQIINVYFGGNVIQDLATATTHAWDEADKTHSTYSIPNTFIFRLYGQSMTVNSAHHQGIGHIGRHLSISQLAYDNVVEAIYHDTLPIIAVQWHPERMSFNQRRVDTADGQNIFEYYKELLCMRNSAN